MSGQIEGEHFNSQGFTDRDLEDMASHLRGIAGKRGGYYEGLLRANRGLPQDGEARATMTRMLQPFLPKPTVSLPTVQSWMIETPVTGESRNFKPDGIRNRP